MMESLNVRKHKFVIEPNYMCLPQTVGSLGVVVKKADVLVGPDLMVDGTDRIKRQKNSEYYK